MSSLLNTYNRFPLEFIRGEGIYLYDNSGKQYLDFLSGISVTNFGHSHPKIIESVRLQIDKIWHTSNHFEISLQEKVAHHLISKSGLDKVFFCNTGTEASEAAIKFSRKFGKGRFKIITALGGFHGRTMGSLSASAQEKLQKGFHPLTPGFVYVAYNDTDTVRSSITDDTIAVMVESIQGENGVIVPSENYLIELRKICDENNLLLILDEVQTGFGRTGKFLSYQWQNIIPDMVTLAKAIANGLPLGAVICSEKVAREINPGDHGSTFGGNPVSLAAAETVCKLITDDLLLKVQYLGSVLLNSLKSIKSDLIVEVRAQGLMVGIQIADLINVRTVVEKLLNEGFVTGVSGNNTIRVLPPLIVKEDHIHDFVKGLKGVLENF